MQVAFGDKSESTSTQACLDYPFRWEGAEHFPETTLLLSLVLSHKSVLINIKIIILIKAEFSKKKVNF
jgi:hypothetical protein